MATDQGAHAGGPEAVVPATELQKEQAMRAFEMKVRVQERLEQIDAVLCIMSGKGGVGKSTVAVNLAAAFAASGRRTGLADYDLTNPNDPTLLGVGDHQLEAADESHVAPHEARPNLHVVSTGFLVEGEAPIAWRGPIKTAMMRQLLADVDWGELDVLVVDLPPGTSDEALSVAQTFPRGTPCLLVTTPQETAAENVSQNVRFCQQAGLSVLGLVENFAWTVCPHCDERFDVFPGGGEAASGLGKALGLDVLASIPLVPAVGRAQDRGVLAIETDEPNAAGDALRTLAERTLELLDARA